MTEKDIHRSIPVDLQAIRQVILAMIEEDLESGTRDGITEAAEHIVNDSEALRCIIEGTLAAQAYESEHNQ